MIVETIEGHYVLSATGSRDKSGHMVVLIGGQIMCLDVPVLSQFRIRMDPDIQKKVWSQEGAFPRHSVDNFSIGP